MEAVRSFEMMVTTYKTAQRNKPEDYNPLCHRSGNLRSHTIKPMIGTTSVGVYPKAGSTQVSQNKTALDAFSHGGSHYRSRGTTHRLDT
jgi:hypothetical protein